MIKERFSDKVGPGVLPAADGIWYNGPQVAGGTPLTDNHEMTDHYGLRTLPPSEVGFMQYYYATGFTPPSWFQLPSGFSLPGTADTGLVVPLWIKDAYNTCKLSVAGSTMLPGQPVRLNPKYTGIDGDYGPPPATGCAPLL